MSHADPRFIGLIRIEPNPSDTDKSMLVGRDFSFIDSRGVTWTAHKGDITNGASIPNIFKIIIGGSYQMPYLPASVLHDIYCVSRVRPWRDTANMFYEALYTNGVFIAKARTMWLAVYLFGPHW